PLTLSKTQFTQAFYTQTCLRGSRRLACKDLLQVFAHVLADDVDLQIDAFPHAPLAQRGVRQRIGNERHTEKIRSYVYQGQTHPINRMRSFRYHPIRQFGGTANKQAPAPLRAPPLSNAASTVYNPPDNMTIVAAIGPQGALEIHPAARTQET